MAVTASNASVEAREFRASRSASYINSQELLDGFLTRGGTVEDDHYLRNEKNTLTIIEPRPVNELPSVSVWKTWVSNCEWNVIVAVYGGSFPYIFTLFGAPAGMTIGSVFDFTSFTTRGEHGRIRWPNPVAGDYVFGIRVIGQEAGQSASVIVNLNIADSNAIWCDSVNGIDSTTAPGTKASPFKLIANWYGGVNGTGIAGDRADTTYSTKHVIFRAGTYLVPADESLANLNVGLNKPRVWHAYQNESVILNCDPNAIRGASNSSAGGLPDGWNMRGITTTGQDATMANTFQVSVVGDQQSYWDHTIDSFTQGGTDNRDNPAGLYSPDKGEETYWQYRAAKNIRIVNFSGTNMSSNGAALKFMSLQHYELCNFELVSQNAISQSVVALKHDHRNGVNRLIYLPNAISSSALGAFHFLSTAGGNQSEDNEMEYCYFAVPSNGDALLVGAGNPDSNLGTVSIRRVTIGANPAAGGNYGPGASNHGTGALVLGANVVQNVDGDWSHHPSWDGNITQESTDVKGTSGLVDTANGQLIGATRDTYLGKKGWEIA